jgi:hypothetical protein
MLTDFIRVWDGVGVEYLIPAPRKTAFDDHWKGTPAGIELDYFEHVAFVREFGEFELPETQCLNPWPIWPTKQIA